MLFDVLQPSFARIPDHFVATVTLPFVYNPVEAVRRIIATMASGHVPIRTLAYPFRCRIGPCHSPRTGGAWCRGSGRCGRGTALPCPYGTVPAIPVQPVRHNPSTGGRGGAGTKWFNGPCPFPNPGAAAMARCTKSRDRKSVV